MTRAIREHEITVRNSKADLRHTASQRHHELHALWCRGKDLNLRPPHYKRGALPTELPRQFPVPGSCRLPRALSEASPIPPLQQASPILGRPEATSPFLRRTGQQERAGDTLRPSACTAEGLTFAWRSPPHCGGKIRCGSCASAKGKAPEMLIQISPIRIAGHDLALPVQNDRRST
jgi:hypothetical protein